MFSRESIKNFLLSKIDGKDIFNQAQGEHEFLENEKKKIKNRISSITVKKGLHEGGKEMIQVFESHINDIIKNILDKSNEKYEIINHDHSIHKNIIKDQKTIDTFSNLSSLLRCFEIGKNNGKDLIYFVEDDYLHFNYSLEEMIGTYERISSQLNKDLFICPADYPFLYMDNEKTNLLIGNKRHWRTISKTLCTFMTSKEILNKYWDNFYKNCLDRHEPFEKYLNEIYEKEICISPVKSISIHMTNVNSSYGLSPFIDYKSLWEENK